MLNKEKKWESPFAKNNFVRSVIVKTLPVILADYTKTDKHIALLSEGVRQEQAKSNKILFITPREQKQKIEDLIAEKNNIDISEKIKQISKEIFGK